MSNLTDKDRLDQALDSIDESKRSSLRKLVVGAAFAAPVVASFAVNGMMVSTANAAQPTDSSGGNSNGGNSSGGNQ